MTDDFSSRFWRALETHGIGWIDNGKPDTRCYCGYRPRRLGESWHKHVSDAVTAELLPQPAKPERPTLEDLDGIPAKKHTWGDEWDSNYHQGRICTECGESSECEFCKPHALDSGDCLVSQARSRNRQTLITYREALHRWVSQMDYWREQTADE